MIGNCSIVIRAYNEAQHFGRLLEGIKQQTVKDVDVILVDSGSTDLTIAIAEALWRAGREHSVSGVYVWAVAQLRD